MSGLTLTTTVQFLCIGILETLLRLTLKRRAEILADIFGRLLWYFCLSCKKLRITNINDYDTHED